MSAAFNYDVFISYSSRDKPVVRELAERLKSDGLRVWFDEWEIKAGDMIGLKIEQGLERSQTLVLVMSTNAFASEWVTLERHTALFRDPTNVRRRFIPVRLDDAEINDALKQFAYIDWRQRSDEQYIKLLEGCRLSVDITDRHTDSRTLETGGHEIWQGVIGQPMKWTLGQVPGIRRRWSQQYWRERAFNIPQEILTTYIPSFLNTNRCPAWDQDMCSPERISASSIRFVEMDSAHPPGLTANLEGIVRSTKQVHVTTVQNFLQYMYDAMSGARGKRRNVFVILAKPGAGKSALAVQLATLMATEVQDNAATPLPVYINLKYFDDRVPSADALTRLVERSIRLACPRYLPQDESQSVSGGIIRHFHRLESQGGIFYLLDSMDEMPSAALNQRVQAIAEFISARRHLCFFVACRRADFVKLADHTHNLQVQRVDLLSWSRKMAASYVDAVVQDKRRRRAIKELMVDSSQNEEEFDPVPVVLLARTKGELTLTLTISELWERFVSEKLRPFCNDERHIESIKVSLGALAYSYVWGVKDGRRISQKYLAIARSAGLLRDAAGGPAFEIRPLESHFAGRELVRRAIKTKSLPAEVNLVDINMRESLHCACEQGFCKTEWADILVEQLSMPGTSRFDADRLAFAAACIPEAQLKGNVRLERIIAEKVERIVIDGDDVDKQICLDAIEARPELLGSKSKIEYLFSWIVWEGPPSTVTWLFRTLNTRLSLLRRYVSFWFFLIIRTLHECSFAPNLTTVVAYTAKRHIGTVGVHFTKFACVVLRFATMFTLLYIAYFIGQSLTGLILGRILGLQYTFVFFITELRAQGFYHAIPFLIGDVSEMSIMVFCPWLILRQLAKTSSRFHSALVRAGTLIMTVFVMSASWRLIAWLILHLAIMFKLLGYALLGVIFILACIVAIVIARNPRTWPDILARWREQKRVDVPPEPNYIVPDDTDTDAIELPEVEPGRLLMPKPDQSQDQVNVAAILTYITLGLWSVTAGATLFLWGISGALVVVIIGGAIYALYAAFVHQWIRYLRAKRQLRATIAAGLAESTYTTVQWICNQVLDASQPTFVRLLYVETLDSIRYDEALGRVLSSAYERLEVGRVRTRMAELMARAYFEASRNRPANSDQEMAAQ